MCRIQVRIAFRDLTIAYTGDAGPSEALAELAAGVDLLLTEASDRHQQPGVPPSPISGYHLSGADAGRFAARAGVRSLVPTHFWPGIDREAIRAAAAAHFAGPVALAEEGMVISLG